MSSTRTLWIVLITLPVAFFGVLLWTGMQIYQQAPPMPEKVVSQDGATIDTKAGIEIGRQVRQSMGGMQLGSIWGHGGYVAPDWSADWAHRELIAILDQWARRDFGADTYAQLNAEQQAGLQGQMRVQGDTIFAIGALILTVSIAGLWLFPKRQKE